MYLNQLPIICLTGPTAVGKSQLAIQLAKTLPCEIISVDSVMVYRGMDIGTAKPDADTLRHFPHHLVNIRNPIHPYSVGDFFGDVKELIEISLKKEHIPLLVGGTMMYFNILRKGLAFFPPYNEHVAYPIKKALESMDSLALYKQLQHYDAKTASRLHQNDKQRIQRALLVYHLSKKSFSEFHESVQQTLPYKMTWIALCSENREKLRKKIEHRFNQMLSQGFLEEVKILYPELKKFPNLPAYRAVGYRQAFGYLEGKIDKDTLKRQSVIATWQLAKRQLTWLRSFEELTIFMNDTPRLFDKVVYHLQSYMPISF